MRLLITTMMITDDITHLLKVSQYSEHSSECLLRFLILLVRYHVFLYSLPTRSTGSMSCLPSVTVPRYRALLYVASSTFRILPPLEALVFLQRVSLSSQVWFTIHRTHSHILGDVTRGCGPKNLFFCAGWPLELPDPVFFLGFLRINQLIPACAIPPG